MMLKIRCYRSRQLIFCHEKFRTGFSVWSRATDTKETRRKRPSSSQNFCQKKKSTSELTDTCLYKSDNGKLFAEYFSAGNIFLSSIRSFAHFTGLMKSGKKIENNADTFRISPSDLSEKDYNQIADETLETLTDILDNIPENCDCDPSYDVSYSMGVITVNLGSSSGTYVINKQSPNKQIWFSSPVSGPKRFDFCDGIWIYSHTGESLHDLLTKELKEKFPGHPDLDFTKCAYGHK